jgi:hypothetical protein
MGALAMDGTPIPGPRMYTDNIDSSEGYAVAQPRGYLDLWAPYVAGDTHTPLYTAKTYAYAYHLTKDSNMLIAAKRFAEWIKNAPPGTIETEATWDRSYS